LAQSGGLQAPAAPSGSADSRIELRFAAGRLHEGRWDWQADEPRAAFSWRYRRDGTVRRLTLDSDRLRWEWDPSSGRMVVAARDWMPHGWTPSPQVAQLRTLLQAALSAFGEELRVDWRVERAQRNSPWRFGAELGAPAVLPIGAPIRVTGELPQDHSAAVSWRVEAEGLTAQVRAQPLDAQQWHLEFASLAADSAWIGWAVPSAGGGPLHGSAIDSAAGEARLVGLPQRPQLQLTRLNVAAAHWSGVRVVNSALRFAPESGAVTDADLYVDGGAWTLDPRLEPLQQLKGRIVLRNGRLRPTRLQALWRGAAAAVQIEPVPRERSLWRLRVRSTAAWPGGAQLLAHLTPAADGPRVVAAALHLGPGQARIDALAPWRLTGSLERVEWPQAPAWDCARPLDVALQIRHVLLGGQDLGGVELTGQCDDSGSRWRLRGPQIAGTVRIANDATSPRLVRLTRLQLAERNPIGAWPLQWLAAGGRWRVAIDRLSVAQRGPIALDADIQIADNELRIDGLRASAPGERWSAQGRCGRDARACKWRVAGQSDSFARGLGYAPKARGRVTAEGELSWPLEAEAPLLESLVGELRVDVSELVPFGEPPPEPSEPFWLAGFSSIAQAFVLDSAA
ncbi:MAG: AsmA-like C-terminal region-containing protein, partial [Steroidobacteraceae bacterium]|nr:AsmA-like C-terminal region-containing protein [Steroidobacteraceae bacterium]